MDQAADARELLCGVTALRLGLVDPAALARAVTAWGANRDRPLVKFLTDRGLIRTDRLAALEAEVAALLRAHRGDPQVALAAAGPVAEQLKSHLAPSAFDTIGDATDPLETVGTATHPVGSGLDSQRTAPATGVIANGSGDLANTEKPTGEDLYATLAESTETGHPSEVATEPHPSAGKSGDWVAYRTSAGSETDAEILSGLRYRILRLHAKGGLGQVFVARDEELNREVALKEIQGRHANDDESRLRFLIEAEVTGNLEHPGIVPVYGLGRYPDGRPYYAMRFIRGQSMKEAIDEFHHANAEPGRDPGAEALELRKLLGQLVDVCNAMAYAHTRGVLHRDLKPGNIMLGSFGETLVVDWGLAKFKDAPEGATGGITGLIRPMSAGSSSRTLYGSAVGTPQFMSPEQAAGQLDQLGPASDVYSLGSILYTILVGTAPFRGNQLSEMLEKVRKGDFPAPREVNRTTAPALNAICLKAMALRPEDRYATSRALADDLEHWMADEPVSVYREPVLARLARWAKRHRTAVAATAALLVTAVVSLGVYSVLIKREQARTERFYLLARRAVDQMLTQLGADDLANVPQMEPVRAKMLREAKTFYEELRASRAGDPRAASDLAQATIRLGDIEALLGDKQALPRYDDAVTKLRALLAPKPTDRAFRADLARALHARGLLHRKLNRLDDAEHDFTEALGLRRNLAAEFPADSDFQRARTDTLYHLAALHDRRGQTALAKQEYGEVIPAQQALATGPAGSLDDRRLLGRYTNNLANLVNRETGDGRAAAKDLYGKALEVQQDVVKRDPVTSFYRYELAKTHGNLRIVYASEGNLKAAKQHAIEDVDLSRRLALDFQHTPDFRNKLATACASLGELHYQEEEFAAAGKDLDEAVTLAEALVKDFGEQRDYRSVLASNLKNRGAVREETDRIKDAEEDYLRARKILKPLTDAANATPDDLLYLGKASFNLASLRAGLKRDDEALKDVEEAVALHERAARLGRTGEGKVPPLWKDLSLLSDLLQRKGEYARCGDVCERLPVLRPKHQASYLRAARMLAFLCADVAPKQPDRARTYAERTLKQLNEAARQGLLQPQELASPQYQKVRELLPDAFQQLSESLKRQV